MSETKFHPGPWVMFKGDPTLAPNSYIVDSVDHRVARSIYNRFDACLIASAPELYEALFDLLEAIDMLSSPTWSFWDPLRDKASAALAKARGESQ